MQDGRLAVESGRLWVADSIGVIHRGRQILLVAVLSDDQPTLTAGIDEDEAAAVAAAGAIARPAPGGRQSGYDRAGRVSTSKSPVRGAPGRVGVLTTRLDCACLLFRFPAEGELHW